jgi:hypothetical protein
MTDSDRVRRFLQTKVRDAGRQYEEARRAFVDARREAASEAAGDEPETLRLVCRRHAERREVPVDSEGRPACFEADHHDCEGCVEDIRAGRIETW